MNRAALEDAYAISDFVAGPDNDVSWISPLSVEESREYLVDLPERYDDMVTPYRIADIGCGDGKLTVDLAEAYPDARTIGVDLSARQAQLRTVSYESASAFGGNIYELIPELDPFDFVYAVNVLQDFPDIEAGADILADAVGDYGYLAVTTTGSGVPSFFDDFVQEQEQGPDYWQFEDIVLPSGETVDFSQWLLPEEYIQDLFEERGMTLVDEDRLSADPSTLSRIYSILDVDIPDGDPSDDRNVSYPYLLFRKQVDR